MRRRRDTVQKLVELDRDDIEWFESLYPRGSYSWVLSGLLKEFRKCHTVTVHDYMRIGAAELKKIIEEK